MTGSASPAVEDIYPLSPLQEGLLFHALSGERGLYFEQLRCRLVGELDLPAFERTWRRLVGRHAVLRTAFDWEDAGEPVQVVLSQAELPIVYHDWTALPPPEQEARLAALLAADRERGFELDAPPLMRLALARTAADTHRLVWSFHHLLLDGWSAPRLLEEAFTLYGALCRGEELRLPPVRPYRDYIAWLKAQDQGRARDFWQDRLAGFTRPTRLRIDGGPGEGTPLDLSGRERFEIDASRTARLNAFVRQHRLTFNTLVQGAWARLLACYGESDDVVFGITVSGRPPQLRGVEAMVGLFINTLPLRVPVSPEELLLPWLLHLRRNQAELQPFESTPLTDIRKWSEVPQGEPLFETLLVFENYPLGDGEGRGGLAIRDLESSEQTNYPLTVAAQPGERLEVELLYDGGRFEPAAIARLAGHLAVLLESVAEDPLRRVGEWSPLRESERRQLLAPWHPETVSGEDRWVWPTGEPVRPSVYLLDRWLEPVPLGLRGEVFLAGAGLPTGDRRGPAETAEQFLPDPYSPLPGARMAKTGDLGRRTPAGVLERAGARGRRVWIGELRVDLGAVEAALLGAPEVEDAAVLARPTPEGPRLVAYVVPFGPWQPERLRARLGEGAAAPAAYIPVARLPLLPDGEIDEAALARLETIDEDLIARWEGALAALAETAEVAVVARPVAVKRPPLHASDLLPAEGGAGESRRPLAAPAERGPEAAGGPARPAAIRQGEPLRTEPEPPKNLQQALRRAAQRSPDRGILYLDAGGGELFQSYPELLADAERILGGLRRLGLEPGDKALFQLDLNQDFLPAFWGCVLGGFVPIPVAVPPTYDEIGNVVSKLHNAWRILGRPWLLTDAAHRDGLLGLADLLGASDWRVAVLEELRAGDRDGGWHVVTGDDPAFFQLTSGSTGIPKCVTLTHGNILHHVQSAIQLNGHAADDVSLNWMPMDHVGSLLCYHQRDVYLGCLQLHAKPEAVIQRPLTWLDWLERYRVTQTWAPNFAYKLVNEAVAQQPDRKWDLSALRFIMNGGEQVALEVTRIFLRLLAGHGLSPQVMHPTYGMAELSSACIYSHRFDLEGGTGVHFLDGTALSGHVRFLTAQQPGAVPFLEVGVPLPGFAMRIVDAEDRVVEEDVVGRLQAQGPVVTRGYYDNPQANAESFTADGWFNTGDLGFIHDGCLSLTGREKDLIILHGANYYNHEIETCVEQVEGVEPTFAAAASVRDPATGSEQLVVFFTPRSGSLEDRLAVIHAIRGAVTRKIGVKTELVVPVEKAEFPKTTSGKIQRTQLVQAFEAGRFRDVLRQIDIAAGGANTVPDWFFRRVWRRKRQPVAVGEIGAGLVLGDGGGLGTELCRRLRRPDRPWVLVEPGAAFIRRERERYQVVPGDRDQLRRLLRALAAEGIVIGHAVHLGTYGEPGELGDPEAVERSLERGLYDLLHLVQALAEAHEAAAPGERAGRVSLVVVSSQAQAVTAKEPVAADRAALLGLVKTVGQEMPWLSCRHLDLPSADGERNLSRIQRELTAFDGDREVAWRQGRRHVAGLERLDLLRKQAVELPFQRGGLVLVTGGLGGIGREIARYLLREQEVRLLLVGRTPLAAGDGRGTELQAELAALREIGEVAYEPLDVADEARLRAAVETAEARWECRLQGAIHLAGVLREGPLAEETREGLAAVLRPKLTGTLALWRLLRDRQGSFLIGFSSVNSVFGGAMTGAYAAANAALEGFFAAAQSGDAPPRCTCLTWSMWDEIGISRGYRMKDLSRARGFEAISLRQGLLSFLAALRHDQRRLIVGLAGDNRNVRRLAETADYALEELAGFFTSRGEAAELGSPAVTDRFGVRSRCALRRLDEIPRLASGEIDRALLRDLGANVRTAAVRTAPASELERQLAAIWQQVLGCASPVGTHHNFFELGGDSILSIQVIARARELGLRLTTQDLFRYPTIAELAAHATTAGAPPAAQEPVEGEVPLTPIQQWFFEQAQPDPHHFNMAMIFAVRERLDGGALARAVWHLLRHHDALRLRFAPAEPGWRQWHAGLEGEPPVIRLDLSGLPAAERRQVIESAAGQLQRSLHLSDGPLLRVAWFDAGDGVPGRLLLVLHHLVVDGVSWRILLEDLQSLYGELSRGRAARLPAKTTPFQHWAELLRELARGDALKTELSYWLAPERHQRVAALPRDFPADGGEINDDLAARTLTLRLDAAETRALLQDVHRAYRTRIDDVLLTALVRAFSRFTGQASLLVDLEGHGREDLAEGVDVSRTVGWFTSFFPAFLTLPEAASDGEALKAIKEQMRRIPRRGIGFGLLRYLSDEPEASSLRRLPPAEVSFNYLGQTDQAFSETGLLARADEEIGPYSDPRGERRHLIDVYGQVAGGRLEIHWTYSEKIHRRATIERLIEDFRAAMRALVDHCRSDEAFGYTPSDFPLARLDQAQVDRLAGCRRGIEDLYPLAPMQQGMLFHALYGGDSGVYFDQLSCTLVGGFDLAAFERAWRQVLARHAILRTAFLWSGLEEPLQRVEEQVALPLESLDWRRVPAAEQGERLRRFLAADRERGFTLEQAPLMRLTLIRLAEDAWRLVWSSHHLLLDGWSRPLLLREFFTLYEAACRGEEPGLAPAGRFRDYVAWLQGEDPAAAEAFWRRQLGGFTRPTTLGIERPARPEVASEDGYGGVHHELDAALTDALQTLARRHQLTLGTLVQGAWGLLLSRYSGEQDVLFGATVSGRPSDLPGIETMVGLFINSLPLRLNVAPGEPLLPWLRELQELLAAMRRYESTPLNAVQGWSEVPRGQPLFESLLVFENYPLGKTLGTSLGGLEIRDVELADRANYPLSLVVIPEERLAFEVLYDSGRFDGAAIRRLLGHLETLLRGMLEDPSRNLGEIPLVAEAEKQTLLDASIQRRRRRPERTQLGHPAGSEGKGAPW
jgi:non-ribosomal peptide synthase protein (TIGR01720 family)